MIPLVVNPAAGGGRAAERIEPLVARLRASGLDVDVLRTTGPGHATELARRLRDEPTVLCAGGDGTTFEVVNGLLHRAGERRPSLGLIPLGTGNSFLRDFGITDTDAAVAAVARGRTRRVDAVRITHDAGVLHYLNLLSVGFTSDVGTTTNRWFKGLGAAGYAVATVLEVVRLRARPIPHRLDDGPLDASPYVFLSFSNSRCTGGTMQMAPDADPTDGRLDVIRVGALGRLELLRTFPKIYAGRHLDHPKNSATTCTSVRFAPADARDAMIDGEVIRLAIERLDVVPGALEVLA